MTAQTAFVCPLSWGLGHASRCIPVIVALQNAGVNVIIGGNGRSGKLLRDRFPEIPFVEAPFRDIRLHKWLPAWASVLTQAPSLLLMVKREQAFIKQVIETHKLNFIISDNRYGLHSTSVPSILITHQLRMMHPQPFKPFEWFTEWFVGRLSRKFTEIWVPDFGGDSNLSGMLSHTSTSNQQRVRFIGPLSRFSNQEISTRVVPNKVVVVISGPDPARQRFEDRVKAEAIKSGKAVTIIGGRPDRTTTDKVGLLTIHSHLCDKAFAEELTSAEYIITSGGYSTIMDIVNLGCCATIIPFKGQTEQEYLAKKLHNNGQFSALTLRNLQFESLAKWGISNIELCRKPIYPDSTTMLKEAVENLLNENKNPKHR